MKNVKGTETENNLLKSFAGESQARNRYTFFASKAKKEGYEQISAIFTETANNEKEHAERMYKFLEGGKIEITAAYPVDVIGSTLENLKAAAAGENEEHTELYPSFADTAEKEGFKEIARMYRNIAKVEIAHETRFLKLAKNIETGEVFKKAESIRWKCRNCGYIHKGIEAVDNCPACDHAKKYFEVFSENY